MIRCVAVLLASAILLATLPVCAAEVHPGMLRFPDVSATQIVFVYDNDVWVAPKEGGAAMPLSSPAGMESFPRFSPDGTRVAFSAAYDGNEDVYEMPVAGGIPQRLTVQPNGARVVDFAPDGRVVFATNDVAMDAFAEFQLWYADLQGGLPERMAVKRGDRVSFSADGTWLAFTPWHHAWQDDSWNRYQGGQAADVWTFNLATHESKQITDWPGTDDVPMVSGTQIYYISDAGPEHRRNIWVYDTADGSRRQVTSFTDGEVRWPAIGPQDIVFQQAGKLWRMPLDTLQPTEVGISLSGDLPNARPRTLTLEGGPDSAFVSPQGKRVVIEKRGDIWTIPAKEGYPLNLTPTDEVAEHEPSWSPDGKWIAYICDLTHKYEVYVRPADGTGEARQLTHDSQCRMYGLGWSPDSKKISYVDRSSTYFYIDVESAKLTKVATDPLGSLDNWVPGGPQGGWSPDSRWIAYVVKDAKTTNDVVHVYDTQSATDQAVTSTDFPCSHPTFDLTGDFLYYTSDQSLAPLYSDIDNDFVFANSTVLAYLPLRADVKSPFLARSDEEGAAAPEAKPDEKPVEGAGSGEKPTDSKAAAAEKGGKDKPEPPKPVKIDFQGIVGRSRLLPIEAGNYGSLAAGNMKLYYSKGPRTGASGPWVMELKLFDLAAAAAGDPTNPADKSVLPAIDGFQLTPDASKLLVFAQGGMFITAATVPGAALDKPVAMPVLRKELDPQHEWCQMVWEDYQLYKEKFYDPHMHGVDWEAARDRALAMLPYAACTEDVGFILSEMNAEVNVGHVFTGYGHSGQPPAAKLGLLGCDFERAKDSAGHSGIRFSKVYRGVESELEASGPLSLPGVDVHEGDFLLAVNGTPVNPARSPYELLLGQAGSTVRLTVSPTAVRDEKTREVLVQAQGWDAELRHQDWVSSNRRHVFERSGGRVGYIHVRDTSPGGLIDLQRQFLGQHNMDALVIDERYNEGGDIAHRYIELVNRPYRIYCAPRYGQPARIPQRSALGPKVMIVNQYAGSGGDCFPYLFREAKLGPIVGVRTWGGLVGWQGPDFLLDGTWVSVPNLAMYTPDSQWLVEGYGTPPDIEVVNDPTSVAEGRDLQLDKAVDVALAEADAHPWSDAPMPQYPDHSGVRTEE